jgi:hypothetical protein
LITVDNGIASIEGVAHAKVLGLQVLVTDHHLPAATLPEADVIEGDICLALEAHLSVPLGTTMPPEDEATR